MGDRGRARTLFDRAVLWLIEHLVLLPGITVLTRLVADVRAAEHERIRALLAGAPTPEQLHGFEPTVRFPRRHVYSTNGS